MLTRAEVLLVLVAAVHVFLAPYTKVEESFSLHASRDILALGLSPPAVAQYDHIEFPGAVPRSFVGPLVLAGASYPFLALANAVGLITTGLAAQTLLRLVLAALSCASLIFLARRVRDSFGASTAQTFLLLTSTQFHLLFYASRTLPNMFAFPLVQVAMAMIVAPWVKRTKRGKGSVVEVLESFAVLTLAAVVMRLEILAFLAPLAFESLSKGVVTLSELIKVGIVATVASVGLTVGVDSYFWGEWVWPEGAGILFNVVEGHSSDWGVSPWHYYFTSSLPKIFGLGLPFAFLSVLIDRRARRIAYPAFTFIALLSLLAHKEWRFFVYAIPAINICVASGVESLRFLYSKRSKTVALAAIILSNLLLTSVALYASVNNYPGGEALVRLATHAPSSPHPQNVHIDSHSAMTGASRFLHPFESPSPWFLSPPSSSPNWTFNKSESLSLPSDFLAFDFLVTGHPDRHLVAFDVLDAVEGFARFRLTGKPVFEESVWIMRRKQKDPKA
ncbi:hypothetical protein RQP46_006964 [Phenoliferia psychrophenolica]